ncbi:MAG: glycosyltransferase [Solirubrobacteraceae bacterium]
MREWTDLRDLPYFAAVATSAAPHAPGVERFVLSYSPALDTVLTARDVWFLIGDETARPIPWTPPCPVFRTYGDRYYTPWRGVEDPVMTLSELALWLRNRLRAASITWPHVLAHQQTAGWLPLGMPGVDAGIETVPALDERPFDVGFRGSLGGGRSWSPRTLTRVRMRAALERLPASVSVDLLKTESFVDSYARDAADYATSLQRTKICLVPRGGSLETFRAFEAAASGCVLITEPLSPAWYYPALPRREVRSWAELPAVVESLLSNPAQMRLMSEAGRRWARDVVGAEAIGAWVARTLAQISSSASPPTAC